MTLANHTRILLAMTAQVVLSAIFIAGYFFLMWQFMQGNVKVPLEFKDAFITLLGVLTAGVGIVLSYWFQRQRPNEPQPQGDGK